MVRPARLADAPVIEDIAQSAYSPYVDRIGREPAPMTADYATLVGEGDVLVAVVGGAVVGIIVRRVIDRTMFLENVAVAPAAQGQGIGKALIAHVEDAARVLGLDEISLYTNEAMTENISMYVTLGYTETGRREEERFRRVFFRKAVRTHDSGHTRQR